MHLCALSRFERGEPHSLQDWTRGCRTWVRVGASWARGCRKLVRFCANWTRFDRQGSSWPHCATAYETAPQALTKPMTALQPKFCSGTSQYASQQLLLSVSAVMHTSPCARSAASRCIYRCLYSRTDKSDSTCQVTRLTCQTGHVRCKCPRRQRVTTSVLAAEEKWWG